MSALYVVVILAAVGLFGWACWRGGVERGLLEAESRVTLALRLNAQERAEIARQARAERSCELLCDLGESWRNPLGLASPPEVVIDLTGDGPTVEWGCQ